MHRLDLQTSEGHRILFFAAGLLLLLSQLLLRMLLVPAVLLLLLSEVPLLKAVSSACFSPWAYRNWLSGVIMVGLSSLVFLNFSGRRAANNSAHVRGEPSAGRGARYPHVGSGEPLPAGGDLFRGSPYSHT